MSEALTEGDGKITITPGDTEMSTGTDIPAQVAQLMITESAGNIQASNRNSRAASDAVMAAINATVQTNLAEVGVLEGRAVSGVMATPVASPATAAG